MPRRFVVLLSMTSVLSIPFLFTACAAKPTETSKDLARMGIVGATIPCPKDMTIAGI